MAVPAVALAGVALSAAQFFSENQKAKRANRDLDKLFSRRKAYKTPQEFIDLLNLRSQQTQGFSDESLGYMTGQADAGLAGSLGTALRLGADPNQTEDILGNYYREISRINNDDSLYQMKQIDAVADAMRVLGQSSEAEALSAENLVKDQSQAAFGRLQATNVGKTSAINFGIQGLTNLALTDLYKDPKTKITTPTNTGAATPTRVSSVEAGYINPWDNPAGERVLSSE